MSGDFKNNEVMSEQKMVRFEVRILGRKIPIKILEEQEEATEQVINEINDKIADFQLKYDKVDKLDSLIIVLLSYVFEKRIDNEDKLKDQLLNKMKALGKSLNE